MLIKQEDGQKWLKSMSECQLLLLSPRPEIRQLGTEPITRGRGVVVPHPEGRRRGCKGPFGREVDKIGLGERVERDRVVPTTV